MKTAQPNAPKPPGTASERAPYYAEKFEPALAELKLSRRAWTALLEMGVYKLADARQLHYKQLVRTKNCGAKTALELAQALNIEDRFFKTRVLRRKFFEFTKALNDYLDDIAPVGNGKRRA